MILFVELFGAVTLLLFGLRQVRNGMMRAYGTKLKRLARHAEGRILPSFLAGLAAAVLLQSSTAAAMITATFASQGVVSVTTAFLTILGADIGTAVAATFASQKITFISPALIAIGVVGGRATQKPVYIGLFKAAVGLGLILLSLSLVGRAAGQIALLEDFTTILAIFTKQPLLVVLLGTGFAYLAHSSLAVVLLTTGLVSSSLLDPTSGVYLVLGANVGSGLLPMVANWNSNAHARIPVTANFLVRMAGAVAVFGAVGMMQSRLADQFSPEYLPLVYHLILNVLVAFIGVALAKVWLGAAQRLVPVDTVDTSEVLPLHLDESAVEKPSQALACTKREALRMADIAQTMVRNVLPVLRDSDESLRTSTSELDDGLDTLFESIKIYLAQAMRQALNDSESQQAQDLLSFTASMEHIGDIVDCDLLVLARKNAKRHITFSYDGLQEIVTLHESVCMNFDLAVNAFLTYDPELAKQLFDAKAEVREIETKSIATHIDRLGSGHTDSLDSSDIHLDVIHALKRINSHLTTTAYLVLKASGEMPRTKWKKARSK